MIKGQKDQEMTRGLGVVEPSRGQNGDPGMMDVMKMIGAFINCLESLTRKFESPNSCT